MLVAPHLSSDSRPNHSPEPTTRTNQPNTRGPNFQPLQYPKHPLTRSFGDAFHQQSRGNCCSFSQHWCVILLCFPISIICALCEDTDSFLSASHNSLVSAKPTDKTLLSRTPLPPVALAPASCPGVPAVSFPFQVASGWTAIKVAGGLTLPRSIVVDNEGRLLLVQNGLGITQHTLTSEGCIQSSRVLIAQTNLNHGMYLSPDGTTLYASAPTTVWSWSYDSVTGDISGLPTVLVTGMANSGHITRTLIIPPHAPNLLLVAHGSNGNIDDAAANPATARAVVKVFDLSEVPSGGYNYISQGYLMGYGLRNEVALAFDGNNMFGVLSRDERVRRLTTPTGSGVSRTVETTFYAQLMAWQPTFIRTTPQKNLITSAM